MRAGRGRRERPIGNRITKKFAVVADVDSIRVLLSVLPANAARTIGGGRGQVVVALVMLTALLVQKQLAVPI